MIESLRCNTCIHCHVCHAVAECTNTLYKCNDYEKNRPHGEWIRIDKWVDAIYVGGFIHKDCPKIKVSDDCFYAPMRYNFCPNCGASMQKEGGEK